MDIALKALGGAGVIAAVLLLARQGKAQIAGVLTLFPIINLLAFYFVGSEDGVASLRTVVRATLYAYPVGLISTITIYLGLSFTDYRVALALGLVVWLVAAVLLLALIR